MAPWTPPNNPVLGGAVIAGTLLVWSSGMILVSYLRRRSSMSRAGVVGIPASAVAVATFAVWQVTIGFPAPLTILGAAALGLEFLVFEDIHLGIVARRTDAVGGSTVGLSEVVAYVANGLFVLALLPGLAVLVGMAGMGVFYATGFAWAAVLGYSAFIALGVATVVLSLRSSGFSRHRPG